jgi:hypothetical protein
VTLSGASSVHSGSSSDRGSFPTLKTGVVVFMIWATLTRGRNQHFDPEQHVAAETTGLKSREERGFHLTY